MKSSTGAPYRITVFGGAREIGGNQILLEGGDTKIMLDFGRNFSRESQYLEYPFLIPRKLKHLQELTLLPPLPGLYLEEEKQHDLSGVFLSHAHLDHMDYVRFIKKEVPIYAGEGTWRILLAKEITSSRQSEYKLARFENKQGPLPSCLFPDPERSFLPEQAFRTGRRIRVGELEVRPVHVDHSVPASYGFVIDGPEGRVAYTGDFRFHGIKAEMSKEFLQEAKEPDVLIMEGTNVLESRPSSEEEVKEKARKVVEGARGLVAASFSSVDLDRMRTFFQVAQQAGRKLLISMRQAALLEFMRPEVESGALELPFKMGDHEVGIFRREKGQIFRWEKKLIDQFGTVDSKWVSKHQREVLLFATYYDMFELLSIRPEPGSVFLYSESEPWNEEGEIEFEKLANWLELLGLPLFHIHASGHATSLELRDVIEELKPKKVVLVHCERPELFEKFTGLQNLVCPEYGKPVEI